MSLPIKEINRQENILCWSCLNACFTEIFCFFINSKTMHWKCVHANQFLIQSHIFIPVATIVNRVEIVLLFIAAYVHSGLLNLFV